MFRWLRWFPMSLIGTFKHTRHVAYRPAHRDLAIPLVNPEGLPGFFLILPLPVISAGAYGRVEPKLVYTPVLQESRN